VEIAKYTGAIKAVACVNGTSALHVALKMAGVKLESEVLTQPLTFVATANAIKYCEAEPIFLDVDLDTMGLSPRALKHFLLNETYFDSKANNCVNKSTHTFYVIQRPNH
jgi:dTDP-4-amino-4,6-dideoxygalactose transaminase